MAAGRFTRARIRSRGSKPRNPPLLGLNCKTLPQYCTIWRKCGWCMNACPRRQGMRLRCPQSHPSCTRSSPEPCTPCGTNPCNLVYIGGRPNRQLRNAASTRVRGDGSQTACAPRVHTPSTPNATETNQGSSVNVSPEGRSEYAFSPVYFSKNFYILVTRLIDSRFMIMCVV